MICGPNTPVHQFRATKRIPDGSHHYRFEFLCLRCGKKLAMSTDRQHAEWLDLEVPPCDQIS